MATTWGIAGIPWMQKIDTENILLGTAEYRGWHQTQNMHQRSIMGRISSSKTLSGITFYSQHAGDGSTKEDSNKLWTDDGCYTKLNNGKNYNTCMFFGAQTDTDGFFNVDSYYYPSNSITSRALSVIGWGARWDCKGSHSNSGGDSQAYPEKVVLFYADPNDNYKRVAINANEKVAGNYTLGNKFSNDSTKWNSYRVSSANISTIHSKHYIYTGMGIQFFHGHKSMSRDSVCHMRNVKLMCGDGTGLVTAGSVNRILICSYPTTPLSDWNRKWDMLVSAQ